jgi:hypothetical protein
LLPGESPDVHFLRPLTGATDEVVAIHRQLSDRIAYSLPEERLRPASFPLRTAGDLSDATTTLLSPRWRDSSWKRRSPDQPATRATSQYPAGVSPRQ